MDSPTSVCGDLVSRSFPFVSQGKRRRMVMYLKKKKIYCTGEFCLVPLEWIEEGWELNPPSWAENNIEYVAVEQEPKIVVEKINY